MNVVGTNLESMVNPSLHYDSTLIATAYRSFSISTSVCRAYYVRRTYVQKSFVWKHKPVEVKNILS